MTTYVYNEHDENQVLTMRNKLKKKKRKRRINFVLIVLFLIFFLLINIYFECSFRCFHCQNSQIKILVINSNMIFKYHIILKFRKQQICPIFFSVNLITDIIIYICSGNLTWISRFLYFLFNQFI